MNPQKISDIWKALRKIYQMRPTIGIFSNFCRSYKQNKGIHAILEKVQQPVLHHGKKNEIYQKSAIQIFLQSFAMDLYIKWACKTVEKVAVISKRT